MVLSVIEQGSEANAVKFRIIKVTVMGSVEINLNYDGFVGKMNPVPRPMLSVFKTELLP